MNMRKKESIKSVNTLCTDPEKLKKMKIRANLTLPKTVLQVLLEGTMPPKAAIKEAVQCIDEVVTRIEKL